MIDISKMAATMELTNLPMKKHNSNRYKNRVQKSLRKIKSSHKFESALILTDGLGEGFCINKESSWGM